MLPASALMQLNTAQVMEIQFFFFIFSVKCSKSKGRISLDRSPGIDLQPVRDLSAVVGVGRDQQGLAPLRGLRLVGHGRRLIVAGNAARDRDKGHLQEHCNHSFIHSFLNFMQRFGTAKAGGAISQGVLPQQGCTELLLFWGNSPQPHSAKHWKCFKKHFKSIASYNASFNMLEQMDSGSYST